MLSIHCPNCGGTNIFDETKNIPTYCGFCSAHLPDMTEFVKKSLDLKVDEQYLDLDRQRHNMEMETMEKQIKKSKATKSIGVKEFILLLLMFALLFWLLAKNH